MLDSRRGVGIRRGRWPAALLRGLVGVHAWLSRRSLVEGALLMENGAASMFRDAEYCPRFHDLSYNENVRISYTPRSIGSRGGMEGKDVLERRKSQG